MGQPKQGAGGRRHSRMQCRPSPVDAFIRANELDYELVGDPLIAWVRVEDRGQRRRVPREPLREEEVPRRPVHVGHRRVPHVMERVVPVELRPPLAPREAPLSGAG